MNEELSYQEYKEEVGYENVTDELLSEVSEKFPNEFNIPYHRMVLADDLYEQWVDDLRLEVNSENWSVVAGRADDLTDFESEYRGKNIYFDGDAYLTDEPLMMEDIM